MKQLIIPTILFGALLLSCNNSQTSEDNNNDVNQESSQDSINLDNDKDTAVITPDMVSGPVKEYYPSGALKIEGNNNQDGERDGLWISYYEDGTKWSESYFVNGLKDGHSITFYPNGSVRYVGEYKKDIKTGHWKFYDEAGEITNEETYD